MFEVNQVNLANTHSEYEYNFPTIDFKFQNTGTATAFLWRFAVDVVQAEIDPTPVLHFGSGGDSSEISIGVQNRGWGVAQNCQIQMDGDLLDLFTNLPRQYKGTIQSGAFQHLLDIRRPDRAQLRAIPDRFKEKREWLDFDEQTGAYIKKEVEYLKPAALNIIWRCSDANLTQHEGKEQLLVELDMWGDTIPPGTFHGSAFSDTTYICIMDPSTGPYEKIYVISRKIPPGDVERFHIMIGSPMSCRFLIRFKFHIDQSKVIESETFFISIWNPVGSWHPSWNTKYKDGEELHRELERVQSIASGIKPAWWGQNEEGFRDLQREAEEALKNLQKKALNYPFLE